MERLMRRQRAGIDEARRQLEQSQSERPEVERVARALERQYGRNNFARRVDLSLRGRP